MYFGLVHRGEPLEARVRVRPPPCFEPVASSLRTLAGGLQRGFNDLGALR